jgi:hypothetical protein
VRPREHAVAAPDLHTEDVGAVGEVSLDEAGHVIADVDL